jgi:O-methyltransferase involved in polyketide biosynthesis
MSGTENRSLTDVEKTLLIPLYIRAIESRRPDALWKDDRAEELVRKLDSDAVRRTAALTEESGRAVIALKGREIDRIARDFLAQHADAAVVHIGCGLDTRFERVDDGRVEWYDLDLPEVIALRRRLAGGESGRRRFIAGSVLESGWTDAVSAKGSRSFLFLAEGVFMYFEQAQVRRLVVGLRDRFPGAELAFDAFSPFLLRSHNRKVDRTGIGARLHWALTGGRELERWGGIRLLREYFPYREREPRVRRFPILLVLPLIAKGLGVFHYRLRGD